MSLQETLAKQASLYKYCTARDVNKFSNNTLRGYARILRQETLIIAQARHNKGTTAGDIKNGSTRILKDATASDHNKHSSKALQKYESLYIDMQGYYCELSWEKRRFCVVMQGFCCEIQ